MVDYSYQKTASSKLLEMTVSNDYIATILAACPSAGKSTIIVHFLNDYLELNPLHKVVLFTHNLNNLTEQMLDGFTSGPVRPRFTFGNFAQNVQVRVGTICGGLSLRDKADLVIFDEAHQFYLKDMANKVVEQLNPHKVVGMTGTPSYFNEFNIKANGKKFGMYYISAEDLVDLGVFSNVVVDIVSGSDTEQKLNMALKKATDLNMNLAKIIITAKDQMQANMIGYLMKNKGRRVAVSTSAKDPDNRLLNGYKNNEYDTLVVVNKGILGFSDCNTTGMIDLRASRDIDCRSQTFARILRRHPDLLKKFYISAVDPSEMRKEIKTMHGMLALMKRKNFVSYIN